MDSKLILGSSPHIKSQNTTSSIMLDVIIALLPACAFGCVLFGLRALAVVIVCIASSVLSEFLWNFILKKPNTVKDLSAVVTGLLLGMNLPSEIPLWMPVFGSAFAIIIVKQIFGGIGCNLVNPAITARIVMLLSFSEAMTKFIEPVSDTVSMATPLVADENIPTLKNLFFGMHSGCIGETSAFLLLIGGTYLIIRRVISPIIPLSFIGTVALLSVLFGGSLSVSIFGGGLILGAVFMATDYTTSPVTPIGKAVFGVGCGLFTFLIRQLSGSMPEGVSYSILIMNILVPYIEKIPYKKPFGFKKEQKKAEKE